MRQALLKEMNRSLTEASQVSYHNQLVGRLDMINEFQSQVEGKEEDEVEDAGEQK
jgi:hypothetical protein